MAGNNLRSDPKLRELVKDFFVKASRAIMKSPDRIPAAIQGRQFRMVESLVFITDDDVNKAERELIAKCIALLGARFGHEKEISEIAWKSAQTSICKNDSSDIFLDGFLAELEKHSQKHFWYICPNYLITFHGTTNKLAIGPVEAMPSADVIGLIPGHHQFDVSSGKAFKHEIINGKITVELPPVVWRVGVNCAAGHVAEEAAWNVDMAVSLLRLHYQKDPSGFFPGIGDVEAPPFILPDVEKRHVTTTQKGLSTGGWSIPHVYALNDEILATTVSKPFLDRTTAIFNGKSGALSSRFGQGLGWLTRGRRSQDRAERFLFFFTAIEALLSSDDKSAPVVQTIARQAAVILAEDPKDRMNCANKIKKLYGARSALVHAGKRKVSQTDANAVQYIAEKLYLAVMHQTGLNVSFDSFQKSLKDATYGTKWQPPSGI